MTAIVRLDVLDDEGKSTGQSAIFSERAVIHGMPYTVIRATAERLGVMVIGCKVDENGNISELLFQPLSGTTTGRMSSKGPNFQNIPRSKKP